jgi:hypothetical protein
MFNGDCKMAKAISRPTTKVAARGRLAARGRNRVAKAKVEPPANREEALTVDATRVGAVMRAAKHSGLLGDKSTRIGGRISPALLEQAKKQTGIQTDTDLIEFALATVALDDNFSQTFEKVRGTVDPSLKLGF